ncbi:MAG: GNAT family N-acetyltransferase [Rhodoferax sp.]
MEKQTIRDADDYVIRVLDSPLDVDASAWNQLLLIQSQPTPFMRHEFLCALHTSGCASADTGWTPKFFLLERRGELQAACVIYLKSHSEGEFVFDWGWARAYQQHGLVYHPKAVCAVPFIPVPGTRLLATSQPARQLLAEVLLNWCAQQHLSGLHHLFASDEDLAAFQQAGMLLRHTVQFHWTNTDPGYASFDAFLATLSQDKRKKIRQERRKVAEAGVTFRVLQGRDISADDWDFFYRCYQRTYLEHGNPPYFNRNFFACMATDMPEDWLLFIALQQDRPIASSLVAINASCIRARGQKDTQNSSKVAYGRYWGALARVDCLHFEACYYQPLAWCIANGYQRFEGGAQGEHKLARALLPVTTRSAHWLAHPQFFAAIDDFLTRERAGIGHYIDELKEHSPFKLR